MHKIIPSEGNLVTVEVSGKLTQEDYEELVPSWRAVIARHGKMRLLFVMHDFHGWEAHAAWDDLRFDVKHAGQVERIAMVGEKKWQDWMTNDCILVCRSRRALFRLFAADTSRTVGQGHLMVE